MVATAPDQIPKLEQLLATANANGVPEVVQITASRALAMEPEIRCVAALHSPVTGVLDSHAFMLSLQGELEEAGGMIAFNAPVLSGEATGTGFLLEVGGETPMRLACTTLINAAGHGAAAIAATLAGLDPAHVPQTWFAKGHYFALSGVKSPFRQLIYPMPEQAGLGIHATIDLGGQVKFGPDVKWVDGLDYTADETRSAAFHASIRQYWPGLPDGALTPSYTGIRPKIVGPGEPAGDFRIDGPERHGLSGLVNLFGIESPGLTSSLAIADAVMARLDGTA
jgi:L-2-hydroxyglutarate oxidase LhgO